MKQIMQQFLTVVLSVVVCVSVAAQTPPNTLSPAEKEEGFKLLFDGKKISPEIWQADEIPGYQVENGEIVCVKGNTLNMLTVEEFGDFVFRFEFLLPPGGNNGIGIRAESAKKSLALNGMKIQVLDDTAEKYKTINEWQYNGSIWGIVPAKRGHLKPVGEWNVEEITAKGTKITVILNGVTILDTDIADFKDKPLPDGRERPELFREKGFIGFDGHYDPVRFRNIRIKRL